MKAINYILTHYQLPKYKDFSSRAVLKALANTLKELESRKKRIEFMKKPAFDSFIDEFNLEIIDNNDTKKELPF